VLVLTLAVSVNNSGRCSISPVTISRREYGASARFRLQFTSEPVRVVIAERGSPPSLGTSFSRGDNRYRAGKETVCVWLYFTDPLLDLLLFKNS